MFVRSTRIAVGLSVLAVSACNCEDEGGLRDVSPHLEASPERIDFGEVTVGELKVKPLSLSNSGGLAVSITRFAVDPAHDELGIAQSPPGALAPNETVDAVLSYSPKNLGEDRAILVIEADDERPGRTIELVGIGVSGGVVVIPNGPSCGGDGSLSFGDLAPGQAQARTITVTNSGSGPLTIRNVSLGAATSPEISLVPVPPSTSIATGESIEITVSYAPIDGGADVGTLSIQTDAPENGTTTVSLCGRGIAPALCARPAPLDFGVVALSSRKTSALVLENCGLLPLELRAVTIPNDAAHATDPRFSVTPFSPATLPPGDEVEVEVTFDATTLGVARGFVAADSNDPATPRTFVPLSASAARPCDLQVLPQSLAFVGTVGATSTKPIIILNAGAATCRLDRIEITAGSPPFSIPAPVPTPATLTSGGSLQLDIAYSPAGPTMDQGTLELEESGVVTFVPLNGDATTGSGCRVDVTPPALQFGVVALGQETELTVTVSNANRSFCLFRGASIASGSAAFQIINPPALSVILSSSPLALRVAYHPTAAGPAQDVLNIETNDRAVPTTSVPLFGTGAPSGICVDPVRLPFGTRAVGSTATREFRVTACGTETIRVSGLSFVAPVPQELTLVNPPGLPMTLAPGASQLVTVQYAPVDAGIDDGTIAVVSDDTVLPMVNVLVSGEGVIPATASAYVHTETDLYAYDPVTRATTLIGAFNPSVSMTDIAIDSVGAMYGVDTAAVYRIDPITAQVTHLFDVDSSPVGLTCLSDGTLVVAGTSIQSWDPSRQQLLRTMVPAGTYLTSGDIIALPDGFLYWSVSDLSGDSLVRVDPSSGITSLLGDIGVSEIYGLGYANGELLGFSANSRGMIIDPVSGAATTTFGLAGNWYGATTNPVLW
ncbi:MAG: choice-of-anchor D domain-containing protein [Deltaproteobacteria bacterium]|nr:choice-of-anchor D domain-containing protein [Deltaproteobacteria bacterium]